MTPVEVQASGVHGPLYQAVLDAAATGGQSLMESLVRATRRALHEREAGARTIHERQGLVGAREYLNKHESALVERYALALPAALAAGGDRARPKVLQSVHFDQLELMDEQQIVERVELARAEQVVVLAVERSLAEFNPLMCAAAGFSTVRAERNPVRPELYVQALQTVMIPLQLSAAVRVNLMLHMSEALGTCLASLYSGWTEQLRGQGVLAAAYAVRPSAGGSGYSTTGSVHQGGDVVQGRVQPQYLSPQTILPAPSAVTGDARSGRTGRERRVPARHDESLLTLGKLRQLLSGELEPLNAALDPVQFAAQFAREFEGGLADSGAVPADFDATVPAAFEILQEMQQVEHVIERIGSRQAARNETPDPVGSSIDALRATLRDSAQGLGQSLSLEVVTLMVDNIANDERLLEPVQDIVRGLEPALLRLALVDPRFFSDKQHPARRLLQEITQRSLAYDVVGANGFDHFMDSIQHVVSRLSGLQIEDAQPFDQVLRELVRMWEDQRQTGPLESAVQALRHAEERNLLADKVARGIAARPEVQKMPAGVVDFLCGPWAQVVAHARLEDKRGSDDPGQYRELVIALLWSAQPGLTRNNIGKLTRLVPKLLGKLREGLALIDYPSVKTSEFFELLMNLHQQAFKSHSKPPQLRQSDEMLPVLPGQADSWVAPAEAEASGFMELPNALPPSPQSAATVGGAESDPRDAGALATAIDKAAMVSGDMSLPVGAWVELLVNGAWIRTQLSWASPHGTLFLFTSATGSTQSMTRRSRDKLLMAATMRVIADQTVVDGALDAVVQTAMHNSIDIRL